ncbi:hypothetical protein SISNIDRAFT_456337 [Sistotremastrum niveocremeum HHB9708]|uniref:Uncharacterized protein n=1 Tax=Sistotremastrum niveocremeum HHB9708 TaxID=1314777 RepID=A0A164SSA7_9AGAM|nr:hypothetical protein SISNIDRAFT_456337 [Sistotremastrum niveocremeum HHB9708]
MVDLFTPASLSGELSKLCAAFELNATNIIATRDSEIQTRLAQVLNERHNSCTAIGRLSDELIVEILRYVVNDWTARNIHNHQRPEVSPFLVCRKWRTAAMKERLLWNKIRIPASLTRFATLRDRSKNAPLEICLSYNDFGSEGLDMMGDHLRQLVPRISHLDISWHEESWECDPTMANFFATYIGQQEFSGLKSLRVDDLNCGAEPPFVLNTPVLQQLMFYGRPLGMPNYMTSLVNLEWEWFNLTAAEILDVLSGFPRLRTCVISSEMPEFHGDEVDPHFPVQLKYLESLTVETLFAHEMSHLPEHLETPSHTVFDLVIEKTLESNDALERFFHDRLALSDGLTISPGDKAFLYAFTLPSQGSLRSPVKIEFDGPRGSDARQLYSLPKLASYLPNLSLIDLRISHLPSTLDLMQALRSSPYLIEVRATTGTYDFERLLTALENTPDILCPFLQILDCRGTKFSSIRMSQFLTFRQKKEVPIQELKITKGFANMGTADLIPRVPKLHEYVCNREDVQSV